jgi:hypothetical protein
MNGPVTRSPSFNGQHFGIARRRARLHDRELGLAVLHQEDTLDSSRFSPGFSSAGAAAIEWPPAAAKPEPSRRPLLVLHCLARHRAARAPSRLNRDGQGLFFVAVVISAVQVKPGRTSGI